eukprot:TRINITY_DN4223_c2_g1_i2.p1 TRINITY_DN4223_c2_g1~~TRINITY_DN4223_c2_g1_i2.p1  ORF type:complete len:578 (+),score=143.24 TRINITY_DN4223_c2_g1_i2:71-1804(+)
MKGALGKLITHNHLQLQRVPIPDLNQTLQRYLRSVRPIATDEEFNKQQSLVKDFEQTVGPKLHSDLLEREAGYAAAGVHPYFHFQKYWDAAYLAERCSSPVNMNPYYGLNEGKMSNAASFINGGMKWLLDLRNGTYDVDASDASQLPTFFGTARIPGEAVDVLKHFADTSSHVVVMCKGRFYKINTISNGVVASVGSIQQTLDSIHKSATAGKVNIGPLTSLPRDDCFKARQQLESISLKNKESLADIDSALFLVALDDDLSGSYNELDAFSRNMLHGINNNRVNRWFDKHTYVSTPNGSGIIFEHSPSDGAGWNKVIAGIQQHINTTTDTDGAVLPFEEITFDINGDMEATLSKADTYLRDIEKSVNLSTLNFSTFGKREIKSLKLSPDGVVQQAFQAGYQRLHHQPAPTYEACSMKAFWHGRTETIRSLTPESNAFASKVAAGGITKDDLPLLTAAVNAHSAIGKDASKGDGIDRHLLSLKKEAAFSNVAPELFDSDLFKKSGSWTLSTSNSTSPDLRLFGFGPVVTNGYGLGYLISNDVIPITVTSFTGSDITDASKMADSVNQTLLDIKTAFF